jgi:hypothetical protein
MLLIAMLISVASFAQKLDKKSLSDILVKQGFTGQLHGNVKVTIRRLGVMRCNTSMLQVYYYFGEDTKPAGRAIHASQRLIFIENADYLGQYVIADRPTLDKQDSLRFPYPEEIGNTIKCDREGLPTSVLLDGESKDLFR